MVYFYGGLKSRIAFRCLTDSFFQLNFYLVIHLGESFLLSSLFLPVSAKYVAAWVLNSIKSRKSISWQPHVLFESKRE